MSGTSIIAQFSMPLSGPRQLQSLLASGGAACNVAASAANPSFNHISTSQ